MIASHRWFIPIYGWPSKVITAIFYSFFDFRCILDRARGRLGQDKGELQVFFAMAHIWRDTFCSSKKVTFQRASPTKTSKLLFEHPRAQQLKSPSTTCFTSCKDATKEKKVCFDTTNERASKILWSRMDSLWIWCRKSNEMAAIKKWE
jgi:hypothetical protein